MNVRTWLSTRVEVLSRSPLPIAETLQEVYGKPVTLDYNRTMCSDEVWFRAGGARVTGTPVLPKPYFAEAPGRTYGSGPDLFSEAAKQWRRDVLGVGCHQRADLYGPPIPCCRADFGMTV